MFYAFYGIDGVEQFRVCQKAVDSFQIQIVAGAAYNRGSETRIHEGLIRRMRAPVHVSFEYLSAFPMEKTGKFRCVVCEVPGVAAADRAAAGSG